MSKHSPSPSPLPLSGGEEFKGEGGFELWRRTFSLFLGPLIFIIILLVPFPSLNQEAHRLSAVLAWVLIYWIGEPIPIPATSLMAPVLCVLLGVSTPARAFESFANPIIFLFIGSFILAGAITSHRLDRRIALSILSLKWVGNSPLRLYLAIGIIPLCISMWISDSATTAMIYPIVLGIIASIQELTGKGGTDGARQRFETGLLLTIAYAALIGGIGTPVGTPPNLIGLGMIQKLLGIRISFFSWMLLAVPIMLTMIFIMFFYMYLIHRPSVRQFSGIALFLRKKKEELGAWTLGQKYSLGAFLLAVSLWLAPGIVSAALGPDSPISLSLSSHIPEGVASLVAALSLFFLPVDWKKRRFALTWKTASGIDWGTILLFGAGLSLGGLMFSTGLAEVIGKGLIHLTGVHTLWGITALSTALAIIVTETTSNTATANMVIPMMIAIAQSAGVSGVPPALGACFGASMAFMLPVSTPSNAIVYGSGKIPITSMIRAGVILDLICFVIILAGLRVMYPLVFG